ncbi:TonB-dependent receptor [Granulicella arctica]|uniref:Outer membrane receptor for ferrienterochelin and colicins n=1 Tax=Granulicella arctica TaxID=940613 RepID=A0A7Y9PJK7_9BACT|nr:TonB-dependent receptor [Granulicella arctica]NYF80331.1 outer membrane receptor for ferrienterochelin and colicins [Granulicella arctica]
MRKTVLAFVLWMISSSLWAQNSSGIHGHILDQQGNAVPHAEVTLRNTLSGKALITQTNNSGTYSFTDVAPGDYTVTASAAALASQSRSIKAKSGSPTENADIALPVATVQQNVTVVSASRVEELQQDSPLPIDVVTQQRIQRTGFENVADVLSELPGVVTRNNASYSGSSQEQIDGIASQDVLVLQDGLPIAGARGINSGIIDLDQQNIGRLDKIEVVRGAASSLYGTDAIGGVINLITHQPTHPFEGGLRLSGGSLGAIDGDLDLGTRWKRLTAFTDLELHHINSYALLPGDESTIGANNKRYDGLVKLGYSFGPQGSIAYTGNAYHNDSNGRSTDITGTAPSGYDYAASSDSSQTHALVGNFLPGSTTVIQARLYETRYDSNSYSNPINADNSLGAQFDYGNLYERYHRADATISQQLGSWQFLQGGDEWSQDAYRGLNRIVGNDNGQQVTMNDVWLQDRIQPWRKLIVNVGGRYNHHSLYGSHVVPKIGLVYKINDHWTVRTSYGKGFRSPTLGELYYLLLHPEYFYQVIGNPTLRPEQSESYSAGADYQANRYSFGLTLYRNNLNHLINYIDAGFPPTEADLDALLAQYGIPSSFGALPGLETFIYTNVNQAYTQGINLKGSMLLNHNLRVDGFYAYLDPYDVTDKQTLTERSRNSGYVRTEYVLQRLGLVANIRGNFFGRWLIDPTAGTHEQAYALWNLFASKDIAHGMQAYGAIDNLANSRDSLLTQTPSTYDRTDYGRTIRIGMRYTFPHE